MLMKLSFAESFAPTFVGLALAAGLVALPNTAAFAGASDIDTFTGAGPDLGFVAYQGLDNAVATYAQVITGPSASDHYLTSFTFYVAANRADYKDLAQVYAFDSTTGNTVGSALFTSGPFTITQPSVLNLHQIDTPYQIDTSAGGGINLSSGGQYIFLFTTVGAGNPAGSTESGLFAARPTNPYTGGSFVLNTSRSSTAGNYSIPFRGSGLDLDLAFKATFGTGPAAVSATPEPGAIVTGLSMVGMTGIGLVRGRRRSKKTAA